MGDWSFAIGPPGLVTRELNRATSRKVTFKLDEPSEASVAIDGDSPAAFEIVELATDMYVYRTIAPGLPRKLVYRGRIGKTSDVIDENGHTVAVPSVDYRGVLKRRLLMNGFRQSWTNTDQMVIPWHLVQDAQSRPGGNLGITNGLGQTSGQLRDRSYNLGDPIADKIQELSEVINGFEWDITATDSNGVHGLQLDRWFPQRGTSTNEVLLYTTSGGNLQSVNRSVDSSDFANAVRLAGKKGDTEGSVEPAIQERPAPGTGFDPAPPEGRWEKLFAEDITTSPALAERADWRLADASVIQPSYTVTLKPGFWRGPSHFFIGDTVKLVIISGRLQVQTYVRVLEITVDLNEDDEEIITMTLGYPKKDFAKKLTDIDRRLARLERR